MEYKRSVLFTILAFIVVLVNCDEYSSSNEAYNRRGSPPKPCPYCNRLPPPKRGTPGTQSCCDNSSKGVESVKLVGQGGRGVYVGPITNPAIPRRCCRGAVRNYFKMDQFENIFSKRNSLEVEDHANKGFWDYQSFITASALYQPYVEMAMGRSGAEGWDLRPCPAWIFLAPSSPRAAWRGKVLAPSPPLKALRRPAKPRPIS